MNPQRVWTLIGKDLLELRGNVSVMLPAVILGVVSLALPLLAVFVVPGVVDLHLGRDPELWQAAEMAAQHFPALRSLSQDGAVEALLLHQFMVLLVLTPVAGAMTLAAYSVVGEKQGRTLEPLLATPLTTLELMLAKVLSAFVPAMVLEVATLSLYGVMIGMMAKPGVLATFFSTQTLLTIGLLAPLASLVALQLAVIVSSRVNDPRSAQQIGILVIAPLVALGIAQLLGVFWLTPRFLLGVAALLVLVWSGLVWLGVRLFDRESILTRCA